MIINSLCNTCFQAYELLVETSDVELIKQVADELGHTAKCPRLCGGTINLVGDPTITEMVKDKRSRDPIRISGKELYQAVNGMGLPDEIPLHEEVVKLLFEKSVTLIDYWIEDGKYYINRIVFDGERELHLTSGPRGAQVLKITKRPPHQVLEKR